MRLDAHAEAGSQGATVATSDTGSPDPWDAVSIGAGAAITYDNAHAYGARAYKIVSGTTTTHLDWTSTSVGVQAEVWGRQYPYFTANPSAELALLRLRRSAGQTARISVDATGHITLRNAANSLVATSTATIPLNAFFRLEFHSIPLTSNGTIEARLYSSPDSATITETLSVTNAVLTASTDEIHWGPVGTVGGETYWLDWLQLNNMGWPGAAGSAPPPNPVAARRPLLVR